MAPTPLLQLLRQCTVPEQHELARLAGTKRGYLYQLASCHRCSVRAHLGYQISRAATIMHVKSLGRIPKITIDELATMCAITPAE